jgi:hypothetical protein
MRLFLSLIFILLLSSCCKNENNCNGDLPACISKIIQDDSISESIKTIKVQNIDGECHYWLNTGAMAWDGVEYIVNDKCDTICGIGGFLISQDCSINYDFDKWEIVWEK